MLFDTASIPVKNLVVKLGASSTTNMTYSVRLLRRLRFEYPRLDDILVMYKNGFDTLRLGQFANFDVTPKFVQLVFDVSEYLGRAVRRREIHNKVGKRDTRLMFNNV